MRTGARTCAGAAGIVASAFPAASEAGVDALSRGGNAIDAAVATAWALAVCEPSGSGLGGQCVLVVRRSGGEPSVLAGWCRAPLGASRANVTRAEQRRGLRACAAPTLPGTLAEAHRRHGRLSRAQVMAPAIRLAEDGFVTTRLLRRQLRWCAGALAEDEGARGFLGASEGRFRQPGLARTLSRIAEHGAEDFHRGAIAREIEDDMRARNGLITAADLAAAEHPQELEPLSVAFAGHTVLSAPPPGGGVELGMALLELEAEDGGAGPDAEWLGACAGAVHSAFAQREQRGWSPEQWRHETGGGLPTRLVASVPALASGSEEPGETTHVCAADAEGNVVSLTQSIQSLFGAKCAHPSLGFIYNNYLRTCPRRPHGHRLDPGAFARSNAAPTLVLEPSGRTRLALGAAGSRRIVSSLVQVLSAVLQRGAALDEAVAGPRVHARLDGTAWVERNALGPQLEAELGRHGLRIVPKAALSFAMGAVQAVELCADGSLVGVADGRRDGEPRGL